MNKKGAIRTIEVLIAVILTFIFITYILPTDESINLYQLNQEQLQTLYQNQQLRICVYERDDNCIQTILHDNIPRSFNFAYSTEYTYGRTVNLPEKERQSITFLIGNDENSNEYKPVYFTIYYWKK